MLPMAFGTLPLDYFLSPADMNPNYEGLLEYHWGTISEEIEQELAAVRAGYDSFSEYLYYQEQWRDKDTPQFTEEDERAYQELWEETQELERMAPKVGEPCLDI